MVAEGVETESQFETLRQIGMTKAQGYLISKPLSLGAASAIKLDRSYVNDCEEVHTGALLNAAKAG